MVIDSQPFVIEVKELTPEVVQKLPDYLMENIEEIFVTEDSYYGYTVRPIFLEVAGSSILSEYEFWCLQLSMNENALSEMTNYLEYIYRECDKATVFPWVDESEAIGEACLSAYMSNSVQYRYMTQKGTKRSPAFFKIFTKFYLRWDEQTTFEQEDLFSIAIKNMSWGFDFEQHKECFVQLLAHRLCHGSYLSLENIFSIAKLLCLGNLSDKGILKLCIDEMLSSKEYLTDDTIHRMCSLVYGSNKKCIDYVMNYCFSKRELDKSYDLESGYGSVEKKMIQKFTDDYYKYRCENVSWKPQNGFNSGFHEFDFKKIKWKSEIFLVK